MNFIFASCHSLICIFIFATLFTSNASIRLRGVTISNWPYVERYVDSSGQTAYDGFAIELIDKIANISGFDYELYESPDGRYGIYDIQSGRWDGMMSELVSNRADFAIADLTITEDRKRFVDFSKPFMSSGIAALISTRYANHVHTFSDLFYQADLSYGVILHSATHHYFHHSNDTIIRKMYDKMNQNRELFVRTRGEGITRANTSAFAFISESASLEFTANVDCELMVVYDKNNDFSDFQRDYAIAVRKESRYLNGLNWAVDRLNSTGELEELRLQYWSNECDGESDEGFDINGKHQTHSLFYNFTFIIFNISYLFLIRKLLYL